jgi:hypothetical protein
MERTPQVHVVASTARSAGYRVAARCSAAERTRWGSPPMGVRTDILMSSLALPIHVARFDMFGAAHLATVLALSAPLALVAQSPAMPAQGTVPVSVRDIAPNMGLRLRLNDGQRREGRLDEIDRVSLVLSLRGQPNRIPIGAIGSLWTRHSAARKGAVIGGATAGVASALFWSAMCTGLSEGGGCHEWGTVAAFSVAGAAAGAGVGALIGVSVPRWRLRYVRTSTSPGPTPPPRQTGQLLISWSVPLRSYLDAP